VLNGDDADAREEVYATVREELASGGQVFIVFPLIDGGSSETDTTDVNLHGGNMGVPRSLEAEFHALSVSSSVDEEGGGGYLGPLARVRKVHGRMKGEEKTAAFDAFRSGECNVLMASTVIETGVDVPNATLMIVHEADRFGLATLHQLRGRVGRGGKAAKCFLLASERARAGVGASSSDGGGGEKDEVALDEMMMTPALERLRVLEESSDGFAIAQRDLEMRGAGSLIGTEQSGQVGEFFLAQHPKDTDLLLASKLLSNWALRDAVQRAALKAKESAVPGEGGDGGGGEGGDLGPQRVLQELGLTPQGLSALKKVAQQLVRDDYYGH